MRLTPTILRSLCSKYDLTPSKKYGQNYLIQDWPVEKMIEAARINKNDTVIEVGPGFGVLTFALVERAGKVIAFEIERKLEEYWKEKIEDQKNRRSEDHSNIEIIWGNALKELLSYKVKSYKVVANVPYQITSELLRTLLELENKPESITIMVQKEVAERICAKPGEMSMLAVSVQYYGEPKIVDIVTKGNFWPEPKVDSAILNIELAKPRPNPPLGRGGNFFKVVKAGFAQKRKQLHHNLSRGLQIDDLKIKNILIEVCGNEKVRAEELSVSEWKKIVEKLSM